MDNTVGSARFQSMGGAFGALGGDLSAININPAGSAVFIDNQYELSFSNNKKSVKEFRSKKYNSKNTHGTGCTLSSAITTYLSCGKDLIKSCELGIKYVNDAIKTNTNLGKGNGPINHLNSIILNKKFK